jgi:mRNA-degrading endonuclease RelE of RelBE toxin-antitoxin system
MIVKFRKSFFTDLAKINSLKIVNEVEFIVDLAHSCKEPEQISGFKFLRQYPSKGRIEVAPFRIGVEIANNTIIFVRVLLRNDIYKQFP